MNAAAKRIGFTAAAVALAPLAAAAGAAAGIGAFWAVLAASAAIGVI